MPRVGQVRSGRNVNIVARMPCEHVILLRNRDTQVMKDAITRFAVIYLPSGGGVAIMETSLYGVDLDPDAGLVGVYNKHRLIISVPSLMVSLNIIGILQYGINPNSSPWKRPYSLPPKISATARSSQVWSIYLTDSSID